MSVEGGRQTLEALALLRVVSNLVTGSNGRSVEASIQAGEVSEDDIRLMKTLSKELNALVNVKTSSCLSLSSSSFSAPSSPLTCASPSALVMSEDSLMVSRHRPNISAKIVCTYIHTYIHTSLPPILPLLLHTINTVPMPSDRFVHHIKSGNGRP